MVQAVWIELPVIDLERAMQFYQTVFDLSPTKIVEDEVRRTATLFPGSGEGAAGLSLTQTKDFEPGVKGAFVYLDAGEELTPCLNRVEPAGGKIIVPKTSMGGAGNYATIHDTEGNLVALYSPK